MDYEKIIKKMIETNMAVSIDYEFNEELGDDTINSVSCFSDDTQWSPEFSTYEEMLKYIENL